MFHFPLLNENRRFERMIIKQINKIKRYFGLRIQTRNKLTGGIGYSRLGLDKIRNKKLTP